MKSIYYDLIRQSQVIITNVDADAQAFIIAANITNETQKSAIIALVEGFKRNGTWDKHKAIYPIIGGTADSHKYNLKDPRDLDAAYRLTYSGAFTHSSTGMINIAPMDYANTHLIPNDKLLVNDVSLSFYSRTGGSIESIEIGSSMNAYSTALYIFVNWADNNYYIATNSLGSAEVVKPSTNGLGLILGSRKSSTEIKVLDNGVVKTFPSNGGNTRPTLPMYLCGGNINGTRPFGSFRECAFATIGDGLTESEILADNIVIEAYQTTLGRSVNIPQLVQKAFPTAEGAGAYTTGGRGGVVVKVTNLNDSGLGSFRAALRMTVPRIIVFDVSGRIELTSQIQLSEAMGNFTVAGQSAPEGGITISGFPISPGGGDEFSPQPCNNMIWRYIRFRNGKYTGVPDVGDHNGFMSQAGINGLVFDHCSFSFCDDQAVSFDSYYGPSINVTMQRCMFSENATCIIAGLGGTYPREDWTFTKNLYVDQTHRVPNLGSSGRVDVINQVYINCGNRLVNLNEGTPQINNIGNYHKPGTYSANRNNVVQNIIPKIYTANNYEPTLYPVPQENDTLLWTDFYVFNQLLPSSYFVNTPYPVLGDMGILSAEEAYATVMSDVGHNKYLNSDGSYGVYQDTYDELKISNGLAGISTPTNDKIWEQPILPNNTRTVSFDTNNDGIPDVWTTVNMPSGATYNDLAPSGYRWIEEYLNQVDKPI